MAIAAASIVSIWIVFGAWIISTEIRLLRETIRKYGERL